MMDKRCENCRHYKYLTIDEIYICQNENSDYFEDLVDEDNCCEGWEENYE